MSLLKYFLTFFILIPFFLTGQDPGKLENFGKASFYHDMFHGRTTSNGEIYDKDDFTAAHLTLPYNTILLVTNKENNKSVVVRVNDRGPFRKSRVIDLSHAAAKKIGMVPFGVVQVKIKILNFLDPRLMSDSLLKEGDVWDCYGNRKSIGDTAIFLCKTINWKHAFYMASCFSLDYKLNSVNVKISSDGVKKIYELYVTEFDEDRSPKKLISDFKSDGFFHADIIYRHPLKEKQPSGQ